MELPYKGATMALLESRQEILKDDSLLCPALPPPSTIILRCFLNHLLYVQRVNILFSSCGDLPPHSLYLKLHCPPWRPSAHVAFQTLNSSRSEPRCTSSTKYTPVSKHKGETFWKLVLYFNYIFKRQHIKDRRWSQAVLKWISLLISVLDNVPHFISASHSHPSLYTRMAGEFLKMAFCNQST